MKSQDFTDQWELGTRWTNKNAVLTLFFRPKKNFMEHMLNHKSHWWKLEHLLSNQLNLVLNCLHRPNQDRGSTQDLPDIKPEPNWSRVRRTVPKMGDLGGGGHGVKWDGVIPDIIFESGFWTIFRSIKWTCTYFRALTQNGFNVIDQFPVKSILDRNSDFRKWF